MEIRRSNDSEARTTVTEDRGFEVGLGSSDRSLSIYFEGRAHEIRVGDSGRLSLKFSPSKTSKPV